MYKCTGKTRDGLGKDKDVVSGLWAGSAQFHDYQDRGDLQILALGKGKKEKRVERWAQKQTVAHTQHVCYILLLKGTKFYQHAT